ncbi:oligosaccharide flippase family protein [Mucilaginibacter sp. SMC90]|uniref:lipopolysaccharide biosynthesis protein n=1 Tax=Mucilaginibacter sp. SMC90 TaxID=2929803 RepID=UPI001FB41FF6|nr:oligosaccharide flippase family protein [Mucilaginibacter sp. SMC90]UOE51453.1 oligosaccharide flippase family protein [Mucilaginibacter sp. SMC90]
MLQVLTVGINRFFNKGHERSVKARKNIFRSIVLKGGSVVITLVMIPLTIRYINPTQYGIWLTLSSLITWAALFDMGLGNGLKNKLAQAIALNEPERGRIYVSSTYAIMCVIAVLMFAVFYFVNPYIRWTGILNVPDDGSGYLNKVVLIIFGFFCFQFIVQLINTVLAANQEPAKTAQLNFVGQVLSLLAILILMKLVPGSLTWLVMVMAGVPLLVLLGGSILMYRGDYRSLAPAISVVNLKSARQMFGVGSTFFIIQICALVMYESDNIVITQLFGPKEVTTFNIAYKLFSVVLMFFVVVITPFWSAFTEAYTKNEYEWIKNTLAKINKLWLGLSLCTIVLTALSPWLYDVWVGKSISMPFSLSIAMCIYIITLIWQAIHVQFLNGIGKIKLQLYLGIATSIVNIPLSILLGRLMGVAGIPLANAIVFVVMGIVFSTQTNKIINRTATGVFNR